MNECIAGHEMLNHLGVPITVTQQTLRTLDMRHYLRRDRATGLLQIKPELYPAYRELEGGDYHTRIFGELGPDCSGPNAVICRCHECQRKVADLDRTLTPAEQCRRSSDETTRVVLEVKARRPQRMPNVYCS